MNATPGAGTHVPLYILGSSLFGAQLAARFGLPYGFASHFAPAALEEAVALYRRTFRPSEVLERPYVIAGMNVVAADDAADAPAQLLTVQRARVGALLAGGRFLEDAEADAILAAPEGRFLLDMMRYSAVGTPDTVATAIARFARHADADEVILAHAGPTLAQRLRSVDLVADACLAEAPPAGQPGAIQGGPVPI